MKKLCIIGDPIGHSLSPLMHNAALKELGLDKRYIYTKIRISPTELGGFVRKIRSGKIEGASITIPNKEAIISHLDELTKEAEFIQAVNTAYKIGNRVIGHNTDGTGCMRALKEAGVSIKRKKVIVLGAGGVARAIALTLALQRVGKIVVLNRTLKKAIALANSIKEKTSTNVSAGGFDKLREELSDADILINGTPIGMKGKLEGQTLVTANLMRPELVVNDTVYNPRKTKLLEEAEKVGAKIVDGTGMFVHQGAEQFEIFTGRKAPIEVMRKALLKELERMKSSKTSKRKKNIPWK